MLKLQKLDTETNMETVKVNFSLAAKCGDIAREQILEVEYYRLDKLMHELENGGEGKRVGKKLARKNRNEAAQLIQHIRANA